MKILLVADRLDIGGAETHIYELSRSFLRQGHNLALFSLGGKTAELIKKEGARTVSLDTHALYPSQLLRLLSLLREFKPDVVHAHTRRALFLCKTAAKVIPFPLVFTAHAKFPSGGVKGLFTRVPPHSIAVSRDIREHFAACFKSDRNCIEVIENGINTDRFAPSQQPKKPNILSVSRLDRDCSLSARLLCLLAPRLASLYPSLTITIAGGGDALCEIKKLAKKANQATGRQTVCCVGNTQSIPLLISKCSVFVGVSRAALEAMSCDKPTVICGNEGYFGVCRQDNFDAAAPQNCCARGQGKPSADALFRDIVNILKDPCRGELKLRQKILERYQAEDMAKRTLEVYKKAARHLFDNQEYDALLCGYYGFGNAGDELVRSHILKSLSPMNIGVAGARGEGRIWRFDIFGLCRAIKNSSGLILGGGSLLQNATSRRSLWYYLTLLRIADLYGKNVMLYANGIGPLEGKRAKNACVRALKRVDYASARDKKSFEILTSLLPNSATLTLSCDPALRPAEPPQRENRILCFFRGEDVDAPLREAMESLSRRVENTQITLALMNPKQDEKATLRLADRLGERACVAKCNSLGELVELIGGSRLVISSRLHALIIAASFSRPFVALCRDPKLHSFREECGLPPLLSPSLNENRLEEKLWKAVNYATKNEDILSEQLKAVVKESSKRAECDTKAALRLFSKDYFEDMKE